MSIYDLNALEVLASDLMTEALSLSAEGSFDAAVRISALANRVALLAYHADCDDCPHDCNCDCHAPSDTEPGDPDGYLRARGAISGTTPAEHAIRPSRDEQDEL